MMPTPTLEHRALYYASDEEYAAGVGGFARDGLAAGQPVMIAVPGQREAVLRAALGAAARAVSWFDMANLGRNPARIIPAIRVFADRAAGAPARMVGEPIWRGRSGAEVAEATHHEALINLAFADTPIAILCPYDLRLDEATLADSRCTHPVLVQRGEPGRSHDYRPDELLDIGRPPLAPPPAGADCYPDVTDVGGLRRSLRERLVAALGEDRGEDLVLAISETAANSLLHAGQPPTVRVWEEAGSLVCDIADGGRIDDPLVGRRPPAANVHGSRGLWLVNQLCDPSELRSDASGTTLRLRMRI
jgi:anti-sigma regulatory factor (Ser/Thr protein kinase)